MKLTNDEIQDIVGCAAGVDKGYCTKRKWYNRNDTQHNLTDLREILELRQEVERLKNAIGMVVDDNFRFGHTTPETLNTIHPLVQGEMREQGDE